VEIWICTKGEESKIQGIEMKFLRAVMGKNKRDNHKYTHQRRAQDGGYTEPDQGK
jgi:hypothetical protein